MEGDKHVHSEEEGGEEEGGCSVKRARSCGGTVTAATAAERVAGSCPLFFLVILADVYGCTDNYPARYTEWLKLTSEQRKVLFRSVPSSRRADHVPGCDKGHDFGEGIDDEGDDHTLDENIWKSIDNDENLSAFTAANHCETTVAYFSE
jgi:hypothetical protein